MAHPEKGEVDGTIFAGVCYNFCDSVEPQTLVFSWYLWLTVKFFELIRRQSKEHVHCCVLLIQEFKGSCINQKICCG